MPVFVFFVFCLSAGILIPILTTIASYKRTSYYKITHKDYFSMRWDKGTYGEYLSFCKLKDYEADGARFLFNCYIPKDNGETTEIDMLMIHSSGIYAFESKNVGGWIFGREFDKNWTQTLPSGRDSIKNHFVNPIMQNKVHIKWLENIIGGNIPIVSVVVFSERCVLKQIDISSSDTFVLQRTMLHYCVADQIARRGVNLSEERVSELYNLLYPYTQVSDYEKQKHVIDVLNSKQREAMRNVPLVAPDGTLICPWCNNKLVLRTTQKGPYAGSHFYGCSSYPKCKYIKR